MSIALLIDSSDLSSEERLVPVATEETFRKYWQPGCSALGLRWVPLFPGGLSLTAEDIPFVLDELAQLKTWMSGNADMQDASSRIERLIRQLKFLQEHPDYKSWIG